MCQEQAWTPAVSVHRGMHFGNTARWYIVLDGNQADLVWCHCDPVLLRGTSRKQVCRHSDGHIFVLCLNNKHLELQRVPPSHAADNVLHLVSVLFVHHKNRACEWCMRQDRLGSQCVCCRVFSNKHVVGDLCTAKGCYPRNGPLPCPKLDSESAC